MGAEPRGTFAAGGCRGCWCWDWLGLGEKVDELVLPALDVDLVALDLGDASDAVLGGAAGVPRPEYFVVDLGFGGGP